MRAWWRALRAAAADLVWVQRLELRMICGLPPAQVLAELERREARLRDRLTGGSTTR